MVLIVKLPARRPPKDFGSALPVQDDSVDTGQVRNLPDGIIRERASAEAKTSELYRSSAHALSTSESITTEWVPVASKLDVLLAPSVLKHRYVRGVDKSNIVERPQRIRAVLLGIAGVYGVSEKLAACSRAHPEHLTTMLSNMTMEERESPLRMFKTVSYTHLTLPTKA